MKPIRSKNHPVQKQSICVWTQAEIANHEVCEDSYECPTCDFDKEMRKIAKENKSIRKSGKKPQGKNASVVFWKDRLREQPLSKRPCTHYMKQQIDFKTCTNDYNCTNCDFDQYFNDQYSVHAVIKPVDVLNIEGFKLPQGYYFHPGHTWIKIEGNSEVRIGIDDFAFHLLGPPDKIETPLIGKEIQQNQADIVIKRGENIANLISPISGIVTAINPILRDSGDLAHQNPYSDGWVMRVHSTNLRKELKNLIIGDEAKEALDSDIKRVFGLIEAHSMPLAADGGYLCDDVFSAFPQIGWEQWVEQFLT